MPVPALQRGPHLPAAAFDLQLELDYVYKADAVPQESRDKLGDLFDADGDGTITIDELHGSVLGAMLPPDVDTDGEGEPDGVSLGIGFTAVPCSIAP